MPVTVEITTDITDVQRLLKIMTHIERKTLPEEIRQSTKRMEQFSKKLIRTGKRTGRHHRTLPRRSSAAGEPPKTQSGHLARSIKSKFQKKAGVSEGLVSASAPHALWLEYGSSRFNTKYKARPFFRPTVEHEIPILVERIVDALF